MASLPRADVMWWDNSSMYIRCPHCDNIHHHGFDGKYEIEHRRLPHCGNRESYKICFPFNGQYEIDKSWGFYVRPGADLSKYFARFDPVPTVDVSDRRKWFEAREEIELDEYHHNNLQEIFRTLRLGPSREVERSNRLEIAVSDMVKGRVEALRSYLETSPEKDIFLHGVEASELRRSDSDERDAYQDLLESGQAGDREPPEMKIVETTTSGVTALHMAACEMYPEIVKMLLDYGADPNAKTVEGRTPLMEAAIWGRLDNVRYLLSYGANKSVQCVREGENLRAIDFARDTMKNSEERYARSGKKHQVYKEVTQERNMERAAIIRKLSDEAADENYWGQTSISRLQSFDFTSKLDGGAIISRFTVLPNKVVKAFLI